MHFRPEGFLKHEIPHEKSPYFVFGSGKPSVCITAGIHGWETTSIVTAWEFMNILNEAEKKGNLQGKITVIPVSNPLGTKQMTREDPYSKTDLNRSFLKNESVYRSRWIEQIADFVLKSDIHIDLHSAGKATYWPHVITHRKRELRNAKTFGLHFAIVRKIKGSSVSTAAISSGGQVKESYTLEIGSGFLIDWLTLEEGRLALQSFFTYKNLLVANNILDPIADNRLFPYDARIPLRSGKEGLFYSNHKVGEKLTQGNVIGYLLNQNTWLRSPLRTPVEGYLIYLRVFPRINKNETLAMILPPLDHLSNYADSQVLLI